MTILQLVQQHISESTAKVVLSGGRAEPKKVNIRPISVKGGIMWQIESFVGNKAMHSNVSFDDMRDYLVDNMGNFRQCNILNSNGSVQILVSNKGKLNVKATSDTHTVDTSHNRAKNYLLAEGEDIAVLRELGVFTADNKIVKSKMDKYKQINKFVEIIHHEMASYNKPSITVTDFGCGKSYLTFLVYYYFKQRGIDVTVYGYDLKDDVIVHCNSLATKFGYDKLTFVNADVAEQNKVNYQADMIITLHACDTATDYALYNAITNNVKYIFSVPCCQHEVNASIKGSGDMSLLTNDGIIKERFSALLTDSIRCELLRQCGYSVDCLEFVDFAHSPKNLMIRAKKTKPAKHDFAKVSSMLQSLSTTQKLYTLLVDNK